MQLHENVPVHRSVKLRATRYEQIKSKFRLCPQNMFEATSSEALQSTSLHSWFHNAIAEGEKELLNFSERHKKGIILFGFLRER